MKNILVSFFFLLLCSCAAVQPARGSQVYGQETSPQGQSNTVSVTLNQGAAFFANGQTYYRQTIGPFSAVNGHWGPLTLTPGWWSKTVGPYNDTVKFQVPNDTNNYNVISLINFTNTPSFVSFVSSLKSTNGMLRVRYDGP
jgi:hypothetical protein